MKLLSLFLGMMMTWTVSAQASIEPVEGLPLPWPFPWAKECPVDWKDMEGRYILSESSSDGEIDLKISVVTDGGLKVVRIFRYDGNGKLVAAGFNFVSANQKTLRLTLFSMNKDERPIWAVIKMHYQSKVFSCAKDQLVPILTLESMDGDHPVATEYRLIKADPQD